MKKNDIKLNIIYQECEEHKPEVYIKFIKHLFSIVKEQESINKESSCQ